MSDSCNPMDYSTPTFLSITNSWSLLRLMSIELVIPSNHLILCHPLLLPPSIFPSIRVFSNVSVVCIRRTKHWCFSFNISPSSEHPGLICIIGVVHFYYFYSRPVVSPGGNFVPLGTLGHVWRHFWLSQPVEGQMLLAFSRWKPGMLPSIPPSTGGSPQQRLIRLQMPGVPRWRSPALRHRNPAC